MVCGAPGSRWFLLEASHFRVYATHTVWKRAAPGEAAAHSVCCRWSSLQPDFLQLVACAMGETSFWRLVSLANPCELAS